MSLADVVAQRPPTVVACIVVHSLAHLPERDRQAFDDLLAAGETAPDIRQLLIDAEGITLSETSIRRHRRGKCGCGPR